MKSLVILSLLLFTGCGLKTGLVVYDDSAPLPELTALSYQQEADYLTFQLDILGGGGVVFYQIDRGKVDPDCQCISDWLRFYESSPSQQRIGLKRQIKMRSNALYAYRLRAVDSLGRQSAWSKVVRENQFKEE